MAVRSFFVVLAFAVAMAPSPTWAAEVCDDQGVCVDGADWESGAQLDDNARAKQRKKHAKRKDATLSVELGQGRGSVFIDGGWIGQAPLSAIPIKPGKHDIEVRDGEALLARGVVDIPKTGGDVKLVVSSSP